MIFRQILTFATDDNQLKDISNSLKNSVSPLPQGLSSGDQASTLQRGLSTLFVILGAVSILVITIAGFRYVVSHGDSRVIAQSKDAILYAVIGLVVSIAAFSIVNFVVGNL